MRNVTVSLEEEVARWARIEAARQDTSISRLVAGLLREKMKEERGHAAAMRKFLSTKPHPFEKSKRYPSRAELHDRANFR